MYEMHDGIGGAGDGCKGVSTVPLLFFVGQISDRIQTGDKEDGLRLYMDVIRNFVVPAFYFAVFVEAIHRD